MGETKMTKEQLTDLVTRIMNAEGATEQENNRMVEQFLENVADPAAANYIFDLAYEDLSAEEIVERALAYKPVIL